MKKLLLLCILIIISNTLFSQLILHSDGYNTVDINTEKILAKRIMPTKIHLSDKFVELSTGEKYLVLEILDLTKQNKEYKFFRKYTLLDVKSNKNMEMFILYKNNSEFFISFIISKNLLIIYQIIDYDD